MTRLNLVPPHTLKRWHLLAEYREIPRIFMLAAEWDRRGRPGSLPPEYTMGAGHMRFFYDKLGFVVRRHRLLVHEFWERGYAPLFDHTLELLWKVPPDLRRMWHPTERDIEISRRRIQERLR